MHIQRHLPLLTRIRRWHLRVNAGFSAEIPTFRHYEVEQYQLKRNRQSGNHIPSKVYLKPDDVTGGPLSGIAPWPVAQIQQRQRIFSAFLNQKNIAALSNLQYSVLLHAVTPIRSSKTAKPV